MTILTVADIPSNGSFEVVGESNYQLGLTALRDSGAAVTALLVAEIGNPYDARAVRVLLTNRYRAETAGYLPTEIAHQWWPILAEMARAGVVAGGVARFGGGTPQKPFVGVWVDVKPSAAKGIPLHIEPGYANSTQQTYTSPKKRTNHILHLLLSIFTAGLWIPVWIIIAIANA